jgi:hypothetical protein
MNFLKTASEGAEEPGSGSEERIMKDLRLTEGLRVAEGV